MFSKENRKGCCYFDFNLVADSGYKLQDVKKDERM